MARTVKSLTPQQQSELRMAARFVEVTSLIDLELLDSPSLQRISLEIAML